MPDKTVGSTRRTFTLGVSGQGGVEYPLLIAALVGLGTLVAFYWWRFHSTAAESASPNKVAKIAGEIATKKSLSVVESYASKMT